MNTELSYDGSRLITLYGIHHGNVSRVTEKQIHKDFNVINIFSLLIVFRLRFSITHISVLST